MSNVARTSIAEPAEQATVGRNTCLTCGDVAVPMRVVWAGGDGLADCVTGEGETSTVDISLVDAAPGDEVLVHACVAIQRLDAPRAGVRA
jgi:hydrogenase expression/formation protein HypC